MMVRQSPARPIERFDIDLRDKDIGVAPSTAVNTLVERVSSYLPEPASDIVGQAYLYADHCHRGQKRKSGEPYIAHPLQTALFLADLHLDDQTIIAALLHDVVEDCGVSLAEIDERFGPEVTKLVDGVTKLTRMDTRLHDPEDGVLESLDDPDSLYAESLRKMLVSMAEDIRVVLIKLADRLHNMQTLDALPPEKRRRISQETLDIYSPLAHRLGIWEIKWRLDDLAFRHLHETKYREISKMLAAKRHEREDYVDRIAGLLRVELERTGVDGDVVGRPKSIYSTYRKMQKYEAQGKELRDIYDLFALRVLVDSNADCYRALGQVHEMWHPIPGQFDDYIANPKENMYQALHTTVICEGGTPLEIQIKTFDMHQIAEYGVAAHWRYKEGKSSDLKFEEKMTWLRQLLEWQRDVTGTADFIESVTQDIFSDQVFVYTPQGAYRRADLRLHSGGLRLHLRVLVDSNADCYRALGQVHEMWHPIPGQFDDYIANPKENMYQALHTTVICEGGTPLEIQIKTFDMHQIAEYGVAAHWRYKEGKSSDLKFEEKMTWLRQLLEWQRDVTGTADFIESVTQDIFSDQVFVYTPKGHIVELTSGSTPVDFAYKIHTELGHRCVGAKVNGKMVSLDTPLQSGDTVEIFRAKADRGPSLDWLNPNRGYVQSASARQSVRQWFRRQERGTNIQRGREMLRRELRRLDQKFEDNEILSLFKADSMDDLLANLGSGGLTESQLAHRLAQARQAPTPPLAQKRTDLPLSSPSSGITVLGVGDLLTRMGRCCSPIPGDQIVGFVTRSRGVTVHKQDCPSVKHEDDRDRFIRVDWGEAKELYPVRVIMRAYDRVGLLRDLTALVSAEGVNIASVITEEFTDGTVTMALTVHTTGLEQLGKLFSKLEGVRGSISVSRDRSGLPVSATS